MKVCWIEQQKEKTRSGQKKRIKDEAGIQATGGIAFSYDQKSSGKSDNCY